MLKEKINTLLGDQNENSYCDFYGTREQAISSVRGAMEQLKEGMSKSGEKYLEHFQQKQDFYEKLLSYFEELHEGIEKGWVTNKNWVINTPLETGIAPQEKAIILLNRIHDQHCGKYGPYLSAVDRLRMMTIATGRPYLNAVMEGQTKQWSM